MDGGLVQYTAPKLSDVQISGFVFQKPLNRFPLLIGRSGNCGVVLDHPLVSAVHARLEQSPHGITIEDLRSSNGTYVSDVLIRKTILQTGDPILIMPFLILFTGEFLNVYTLQQQSRLIGWQITVSAGSNPIIDRATISCSSDELIGLIGPSGSGKTTLMRCLSGQIFPSSGKVQLNGFDVFSHFDLFKRSIGYIPQDDIIHRELTVEQTMFYAAKLRLPFDMTAKERELRIRETLAELELEAQSKLPVHQLSGGQRKRVNIAIELLTKPGMLFLDEPTSGLDPALDEKLMLLFKKLSQDGRIIILTTHLLEHAHIFSKIAMMHSGKLIFFGTPAEVLTHFEVKTLNALYSRIKTESPETWQKQYELTEDYKAAIAKIKDSVLPSRRNRGTTPQQVRDPATHLAAQGITLASRYANIILRDRKNTGLLLLQAPLVAGFIASATANLSSKLFMMSLAALWFGCNNSAREICKELPLYRRERMVNLGIGPYLFSKFSVLALLIVLQCAVLAFLTPDRYSQAYVPLILCGFAGIALGLLISAIVDSPDKAIAIVPILLIPQVLFSGIFGELKGPQKLIGEMMISKWSYNLLKKEFQLPSYELKSDLEKQIDESQEDMNRIQERLAQLHDQMDSILIDMREVSDFVELNTLQFDAMRVSIDLKREQAQMEDAREALRSAEKRLRSNARLFVWIDRPGSTLFDWIVLLFFTSAFLAVSAFVLLKKDRLLKQL